MSALRVKVFGKVQGVGFRLHTARAADRLGVRGWVMNEADGSVVAHLQGDAGAVAAMLVWLGDGPPLARVARFEQVAADEIDIDRFEVRNTRM